MTSGIYGNWVYCLFWSCLQEINLNVYVWTLVLQYAFESNSFLSAEVGFVLYVSCGILNSFKWWGQGSGLTKAVAACCLTQVPTVKGHLNNPAIQPSYVPNCIFLFHWVAFAFVYWEIPSNRKVLKKNCRLTAASGWFLASSFCFGKIIPSCSKFQ